MGEMFLQDELIPPLEVELFLAQEEFIGEIKENHHVKILEPSSLELQMEQKYLILQKLIEDINLGII